MKHKVTLIHNVWGMIGMPVVLMVKHAELILVIMYSVILFFIVS